MGRKPMVDFNPAEVRGFHGRWILGGERHKHIRHLLRDMMGGGSGGGGEPRQFSQEEVRASAQRLARARGISGHDIRAAERSAGLGGGGDRAADKAEAQARSRGRGRGRGRRGLGLGYHPFLRRMAYGRGFGRGGGLYRAASLGRIAVGMHRRSVAKKQAAAKSKAAAQKRAARQRAAAQKRQAAAARRAAAAKARARNRAIVATSRAQVAKSRAQYAQKQAAARAVTAGARRLAATQRSVRAPSGRAPGRVGAGAGRGTGTKITPSAQVMANLARYTGAAGGTRLGVTRVNPRSSSSGMKVKG